MILKHRICKHCGQDNLFQEFAKMKRPVNGGYIYQYLNCCMFCFREIRRLQGHKWRKENPEGQKEAYKRYYLKNRKKIIKRIKERRKKTVRVSINGKRKVIHKSQYYGDL